MIKQRRLWLGLIIALLFLGLFFRKTDIAAMWVALSNANYIFVLPAILVYFAGVWLRALRWQYLLKPLANVPSSRLFPMIVIGFIVNNILPGRLGIVARAFLLGDRARVSKLAIGATMVVENIFDLLALLFFLVLAFLLVPLPDWATKAVWIVAPISLVLLILMMWLAFSTKLTSRMATFFTYITPRRWNQRMSNWIELFVSGLGLLRSPWSLVAVFLASLIIWLCEAATFYLVSFSFDLGQPFYVLLLTTSVANLAWAILMPPGGVGPFDYFAQQILIFFGVSTSLAAAYAATVHAIILLPPTLLGFIFLAAAHLSLKDVTKGKPDRQLSQKEGIYPQNEGKN